jgi:hypothetical protein
VKYYTLSIDLLSGCHLDTLGKTGQKNRTEIASVLKCGAGRKMEKFTSTVRLISEKVLIS